jgi:6-phosphogluconolactonase (cycloisomerase 2 family)
MSIINADKYIERLRQTLKDTKSIGVHKLSAPEKYDYLSNRCSDIIRDYDVEYNETLMELWDERETKKK